MVINFFPLYVLVAAGLVACVPTETVSRSNSCDVSTIGLKASTFGLNYAKLAPSPVAEILSHAEAEFISNADYFVVSNQAKPAQFPAIWRSQVKALLKGPLGEAYDTLLTPSVSFFRFLTPDNFQLLRKCAPANDPQIGYLTQLDEFPAVKSINN